MRLTIDTELKTLTVNGEAGERELPLYSPEAFSLLSGQWLKVGWDQKYSYRYTWMGRPVIQLPEDMIRTQEVIFSVKPTLIIETGVAHGGSLIYYASLMKLLGGGRMVGVDIEIRPHNRAAIEAHAMAPAITLIEGSSTAPETVEKVAAHVKPEDRVMVFLDSNHSYQHVLDELEIYHPFVSKGSYLVATDGIMKDLEDVPNGGAGWATDNPTRAAEDFLKTHPEFQLDPPKAVFTESPVEEDLTYWPGAWLRRV